MALTKIAEFFKLEAAAGLILMGAAALAIIVENFGLAWAYDAFLTLNLSVSIGDLGISKPLLLWINDGLMAVFFLLVALEVKREILEGELSSKEQITLPVLAGIGGMVVPAAIYLSFNWGDPIAMNGWAIPAATDIAFALGIMMLLGDRVPLSLKVLLTAIAIVDDLAAVLIIAAFYTSELSLISLLLAAIALSGLVALNRFHVTRIAPYMVIGILLWIFVLKSGVHATLAGVAIGFAIPMRDGGHSPLKHLEHQLHPYVAYGVLPLFAFANAGLPLHGLSWADLMNPVTLGIAAGLFFGKQIGVFIFSSLAITLKLGKLPEGGWMGLYGVALLTGVGFTMSLFIGSLAIEGVEAANQIRLGILIGSIAAGVAGYMVLRAAGAKRRAAFTAA